MDWLIKSYDNTVYHIKLKTISKTILQYHPDTMTDVLRERLIAAYVAHPDGRTRAHKQATKAAYESTILDLVTQLDQLRQHIRRKNNKIKKLSIKNGVADEEENTMCSICMEEMDGKVTLKCDHTMCPGCFAQHSRVNNTCPFCRDEFAPKVKKNRHSTRNVS